MIEKKNEVVSPALRAEAKNLFGETGYTSTLFGLWAQPGAPFGVTVSAAFRF